MNKYTFNIGDWSKDGHNMSDYHTVNVNHTWKDITLAFEQNAEEFGYSFAMDDNLNTVKLFTKYQDDDMPEEFKEKAWQLYNDADYHEDDNPFYKDGDGSIDVDDFTTKSLLEIFFFVAKRCLPDLEFEFEEGLEISLSWGYGLFYS